MYEVEIVRNALIPTQEGELAADLYLPKGAPPAPALVMLLPYNKDWAAGTWYWQAHHYFARRGYAALLADFRGTGSSSGSARAPFASAESDDGVAAVEWAAAQPWCDGNVGMWGISYGGITSLRTASRRPPALKAIIPIMGNIDPERDFVHPYGHRGGLSPLTWGLQMLLMQLAPPLHFDAQGRWRAVWEERLAREELHLQDLLRHEPGDPAWRNRALGVSMIAAPSLCVVGWRDLFVDGMVRAYEQITAPKRLLAGPWMHTLPQASLFDAIDFQPIMLRWWDRWLRGIANEAENESAATVFVQGRRRWVSLSAWPPVESRDSTWIPSATGALSNEVGGEGIVRKPPDATIGVAAGLANYHSSGYGLPVDQSDDDARGIAFTSAPLRSALTIIGRGQVSLQLQYEDAAPATVVAKLADVDPDGRSVFITTGVGSAPAGGNEGAVVIELAPTSYEIAAGHRLRLMIANGDFPRLWPDPNPVELLVRCGGGARGTQLRLPIAPPEFATEAILDAADPAEQVPPHLLAAALPEYEITRHASGDCVTVRVALSGVAHSTDFANVVRYQQSVTASVEACAPAKARYTGTSTLDITTAQGPVHVRAEVVLGEGSATAQGEVAIDGRLVSSRQWQLR